MTKIGLLSDSHSFLDESIFDYFQDCDEIWHAGDIGDPLLAERLSAFKPFRAVFGNIDGTEIRRQFPEDLLFEIEGLKVFMTHIGGYPGRYQPRVREILTAELPGLYICGHSHILKVVPDKKLGLVHLNPGACGRAGWQTVRTVMRFEVGEGKIQKLEVIELGPRGG